MKFRRLMQVSAAAVLVASLAGTALAQGGPGRMMEERAGGWGTGMWGNDGWGMGMGMWGRGPGSRGADWMLDRIEGRLAFLKTELKITEPQTTAWNQLADTIRTAAKHHNERMKTVFSGDQKSKPLPDRIDAQEQFISIRLDEIKQIKGSLKTLYGVLSEAQKKEADDMAIPMVGMGGPWG